MTEKKKLDYLDIARLALLFIALLLWISIFVAILGYCLTKEVILSNFVSLMFYPAIDYVILIELFGTITLFYMTYKERQNAKQREFDDESGIDS